MKKTYRTRGACWRWLLLPAVLLLGFSVNAQPPITIDGNPDDWGIVFNSPNGYLSTFVVDLKRADGTDNQFTSGTKDFSSAADMAWSWSQVSDKNEITNAGVVVWVDSNGDQYMYFMGDRHSTNGSAEIGFWVFQNGTAPDESNMRFSPEKQIGDLLILFTFTNGGRVPNLEIYEWMGLDYSGTDRLNLITTNPIPPNADAYVSQPSDFGMTFFPVPTYDDDEYGPWVYCNKEKKDCGKYYAGSFVEGYVNLTALNLDVDLCGATFLLETRVSHSLTSMLNDFVGGTIGTTPEIAATDDLICPEEEATVCATYPDGSSMNGSGWTFQWFDAERNELVGETNVCLTVSPAGSFPDEVIYYVVATSEFDCASDPAMAKVTFYPLPTYDDVMDETWPACTFANQVEVNTAFANWVAQQYTNLNLQGGVDPQVTDNSAAAMIPEFCGGEVTVTWTLTDLCIQPVYFSAKFKVEAPLPVDVTGPASVSYSACDFANQAALTTAWQAWLGAFQILEDGCGVTPPTLPSVGPILCSPFTSTVVYAVADLCTSDSHTATFTLTAPPAVDVTGPASVTYSACDFANQAALTTAWQAWLGAFQILEDGCGVTPPTLPSVGPILCSPFTSTVVYAVADLCTSDSHTATFTLTAPVPIVAYCSDVSIDVECEPDDYIDAMFAAWKAGFYFNGGCPDAEDNSAALAALDWRDFMEMDGSYLVSFTYEAWDVCTYDEVTCTFYVPPCSPDCQTFYAMGPVDVAECFIPNYASNWGWTNLIGPGTYTWPLWAAAGQCDTSKGTHVGNVEVEYDGINVTVDITMFASYTLDETHIYAGLVPYPGPGIGTWMIEGPFDDDMIYVIVHGVVCGGFYNPPTMDTKAQIDLAIAPNPFRSEANIMVSASEDTRATVEVYNMTGVRVAVLYEGALNAREIYNFKFSSADANQFFLVVVRTPDNVTTSKMLKVR